MKQGNNGIEIRAVLFFFAYWNWGATLTEKLTTKCYICILLSFLLFTKHIGVHVSKRLRRERGGSILLTSINAHKSFPFTFFHSFFLSFFLPYVHVCRINFSARPWWKLWPPGDCGPRPPLHRHRHHVSRGHQRGQLLVATRRHHALPASQVQQCGGDRLAGAPEDRLVPPHHRPTDHRKFTLQRSSRNWIPIVHLKNIYNRKLKTSTEALICR